METVEKLKLHSIVVDKKAVGKRIKQIRENLPGKPIQEKFYEILCDIPDTSKTVSKWERGIQEPSLQDIARIAAVGHVSIEWLLTGKGKGISPTVGDSTPTLRDYCGLLFVDMPRRLGLKWETPSHGVDDGGDPVFSSENAIGGTPCISFSLPLPSTFCGIGEWPGFYINRFPVDGVALLKCAERMQAVQSFPADTRRMVEKDLLSKVPDDPMPPVS